MYGADPQHLASKRTRYPVFPPSPGRCGVGGHGPTVVANPPPHTREASPAQPAWRAVDGYDAPVTDQIAFHAESRPDHLAVVDDRPGQPIRTLTFAELNRCVNRLANGLTALGVAPDSRVIWCGPNSIETVAITHAVRKLGAVSVPVSYRLSPADAAFVVGDCGAEIAYVDAAYADLFTQLLQDVDTLRTVVIFGEELLGDDVAWTGIAGQPSHQDMLGGESEPPLSGTHEFSKLMVYTSGTTGRPKGAVRRIGGSVGQFNALLDELGWGPNDIYLTTGPLYHSGPGGFAGRAHVLGQTVVVQYRFDAQDWLRLVDTHQVSVSFSAPTPIRRIVGLPDDVKARYDTSSLRSMVANAAPWTMALKRAYLADFPPESLFEVYGSTELSVCTLLRPEDQLRKPGSCGRAAPGVEVRLYDADGNIITEPGVPGEFYARSAGVFETYHNAPEKFAADHRDGFQTVGDVAMIDEEGYYSICDRKRDMIISGGVNIYPAEIENVLDDHPAIDQVAVFGVPDDEWGEAVHAAVVLAAGTTAIATDDHEAATQAMATFAIERLSGEKRPKSWSFHPEFPLTGSGKVLKRTLRETLLAT